MDIQPVNQGHTLVVPREHYESFQDLPSELAKHLFEVAMRLGPVIRKVGGADAMNLIVSSGEAAGQDVYHFHIHLIPRRAGDGFEVPLPFSGSRCPIARYSMPRPRRFWPRCAIQCARRRVSRAPSRKSSAG